MSHWGLQRWMLGIKEYVWDRSLCCAKDFSPKDPQRMFSDIVEKETSDCCFSWPDANVYCNNPVCGLICCPIAAFAHIVTCPLASCFCTEEKFKEWTGPPRILIPDERGIHCDWTRINRYNPITGNTESTMTYGLVDAWGRPW